MAEELNSLEGLDTVAEGVTPAAETETPARAGARRARPVLRDGPAQGRHRTGLDQARVGRVSVNGKDINVYFARPVLQMILRQPFSVAGVEDQFDVMATVKGGGLSGQAGAVKHGVSKALQLYDPALRAPLKAAGFLTRDSRTVERKKYGKAKARKSFQFSKR